MANYPNKPWSDGQTFEVVPGETFVYDATQGVWTHVTKATLDSDFQVEKAALEASISANTSDISGLDTRLTTAEGDISTLQSQVSLLDSMSDSDAARIQQNILDINAAFAMLDSDGINLQAIRTDFEAADAALQVTVDEHTAKLASDSDRMTAIEDSIAANSALDAVTNADHDSDVSAINATIEAQPHPIVAATAPTGKSGQLWINTTDGRLYYWNDSDAFVSIVTT